MKKKKKMKNEIQNYLGRYWKKSKYEKNEDENEKERDEETKSFWNVQTVPTYGTNFEKSSWECEQYLQVVIEDTQVVIT